MEERNLTFLVDLALASERRIARRFRRIAAAIERLVVESEEDGDGS